MRTEACMELQTSGWHERCRAVWCDCTCHGDEPPAGVREPRTPHDPPPPLTAYENEPT